MNKLKTFKYYSDAGHGWVAVKKLLLKQLGIDHLISGCSYQRGLTVYLEEDMDASTFLNAYRLRYGDDSYYTKTIYCKKDWSPIRSYERYTK